MRSYGRQHSSALPWIPCRQFSAPRASAPAEASSSFSLPARPGYYSDSIEQSFSKENVVRDCSPAIDVSLVILSMRCYRFFGPGAMVFIGGQDHFCLRFHPGALEKILVDPAM